MRLCGIISRFQLLSPSIGQVAHALLTRPPLSHLSALTEISASRASFDLHVLGTPPAFILSQDQTLTLILILFQDLAGLVSFFTSSVCSSELSSFFCGIVQGCITVKLSRIV